MKSTLSLKGWKKLHSDKNGTTMRHADGHTMRIAHAPLSPKMRGQLAALPEVPKMDLGGEIASQVQKKAAEKNEPDTHKFEVGGGSDTSADIANTARKTTDTEAKQAAAAKAQGISAPPSMADEDSESKAQGGIVSNKGSSIDSILSGTEAYRKGGSIEDPTQRHLLPGDKIPSKIEASVVDQVKHKVKMADGGDPAQEADAPFADTAPAIDTGGDALAALQKSVANLQNPEAGGGQQSALSASPQLATQGAPAVNGIPSDVSPDLAEGYKKQQEGIQQEAVAKGILGANEAQALSGSTKAQADFLKSFQDNHQALMNDYQNFKDDYAKQHINPNQVLDNMNTGKKISTGIALILGGMGGAVTRQGNPALGFLQQQINNDIQAQIQNVGIKDNLVKFTTQQMGNLRDGAQLAHALQTGLVADQLKLAAAKAMNPLAKAAALQASGQLEQSVAPTFQQLAMRKSLMSMNGPGGVNQASAQDPSSYVPYVVPEPQQKEVFKEISNAQNAAKNHDAIMDLFDKADKENTIAGRVGRLGFSPPSVRELNALFLPMIHDQEGRVNEYEQKTLQDLMPAPGDRAATVTAKRDGLQKFMANKLAAPTAKGYNIDLQKFGSTSTDKAARLPPQQQSFVNWARQNPNDPRSAAILKKLGVQ